MKKREVGAVIVVLALLTIGTWLTSGTRASERPPESWEYRWLSRQGCQAPCWEGLTPGISNQKDFTMTLAEGGRFQLGSLKFYPSNSLLGAGTFDVISNNSGRDAIGALQFESPLEGTLRAVSLKARFAVSLGEAIALLGEPTDVVIAVYPAYPGRPSPTFEIGYYFAQASTYVSPAITNPASKPDIAPQTRIGRVVFVDVKLGHDSALAQLGFQKSSVTPWRGFRGFDEYCQALGSQGWCP